VRSVWIETPPSCGGPAEVGYDDPIELSAPTAKTAMAKPTIAKPASKPTVLNLAVKKPFVPNAEQKALVEKLKNEHQSWLNDQVQRKELFRQLFAQVSTR
jgi:uncharacterized protein YllA (UPF0747 family)